MGYARARPAGTWRDFDPGGTLTPLTAAMHEQWDQALYELKTAVQWAPPPSGDPTGAEDAAALNALVGTAGTMTVLGPGTYLGNAALNWATHTSLMGLGPNITSLKRTADVSLISQVGANNNRFRNNRLIGLTVDGNSGQGFVSPLVQQSFLSDPVMRDVILFGAEGIGLDQLEVWDFQSDNIIVSACGGNSAGAGSYPGHRMRCSTTDTVNNIHLRGYRNESFGADGALVVQANSTRVPINIHLTDFKFEKHGNVGIIASFDQVAGLKLRGGNISHTGGLAAGIAQGIDLFTVSGGENIVFDGWYLNPGTFLTNDVRSLINLDGSVHPINVVSLSDISLHQGSGSQPLEDIRFAGTVNNYSESGVAWANKTTWNEPHWSGTPTSIVPVAGGTSELYSGTGVPAVGLGNNGAFYLRNDGGAGTCIYQKRAGAWVATGA